MGPTDPAATRPSRYWFCSVGHSLRPTGAARCREHRGRPWKASLRAPFHSRSPKPEFAARIPSTPHLGSTHHFKRFGVLVLESSGMRVLAILGVRPPSVGSVLEE